MREYIGQICPICKTELINIAEIKACEECGIAHHRSCWQINGGCSTFACGQGASDGSTVPDTKYGNLSAVNQPGMSGVVCIQCGAPFAEGQLFCTKCGSKKPEQAAMPAGNNQIPSGVRKNAFCVKCGNRLSEGQAFCTKCGNKCE